MTRTSRCPADRDLLRLALGQLPAEQAALVKEHVARCDDCAELLVSFRLGETSCVPTLEAGAGREKPPATPTPPDPFHLMETRLPSAPPPEAPAPLPAPAPALLPVPPSVSEWRRLLGPAQGPDEMGRMGPYRVLKVLGSGAMGVVFAAQDANLRRNVALKVMKPVGHDLEEAKQRFLREARATAALEHENIVTIYHVGEENGLPYLAMQLLQGETLHDRLDREPQLEVPDLLRIGREIAEGLAAAHDQGLIHRDIKPSNIWLEGKTGRVKIVDFGLARAKDDDIHLTRTGTVMGTPAFMSPEQARGDKVDARSDLFSLGGVIYLMTTGRNPFLADDPMSLMLALAQDQPPPLKAFRDDLPGVLSALVYRLLAKHPSARPGSAAEVAKILAAIEEEVEAEGQAMEQEDEEADARGRRRLLVLQLVIAGALGFVAFWFGPDLVQWLARFLER